MCVTTDNASNNASFIDELVFATAHWDSPFLFEFWVRCMCHVINLACQDALDLIDPIVENLSVYFNCAVVGS